MKKPPHQPTTYYTRSYHHLGEGVGNFSWLLSGRIQCDYKQTNHLPNHAGNF
jgi:hypothetical protein